MRVVIDTNVLASRFLSPHGAPAQGFQLWQQRRFELLVSEPILAEYERVLEYEKIRAQHKMNDEQVSQVVEGFREFAILVSPTESLTVISQDPPDNRFLECAVTGGAQYIISGDRHLKALREYRGIQILAPRTFLTFLAEHEQEQGAQGTS